MKGVDWALGFPKFGLLGLDAGPQAGHGVAGFSFTSFLPGGAWVGEGGSGRAWSAYRGLGGPGRFFQRREGLRGDGACDPREDRRL